MDYYDFKNSNKVSLRTLKIQIIYKITFRSSLYIQWSKGLKSHADVCVKIEKSQRCASVFQNILIQSATHNREELSIHIQKIKNGPNILT